MMILPLAFLASVVAPVGLDARHIPFGSPLGDMSIVLSPGESPQLLRMPLSEAEFWRQRRAIIARADRNPRMRAIMRGVAENERADAARLAETSEAKNP